MSAAPVEQHLIYQQLTDISTEIQLAREQLYDECELSHLLSDESNPTYQKDSQISSEQYSYAKQNIQTPYYKEILRVIGNFQKRVNNARIKMENLSRRVTCSANYCCATCQKNIQIKQILLKAYFEKNTELNGITISQLSPNSSFSSDTLTSSITSI